MPRAVELIREVVAGRRVALPNERGRFRDHVERAAHAVRGVDLAFNPVEARAVLTNDSPMFHTEHIVIGGEEGEVSSTLTTSRAHRVLQIALMVMAWFVVASVGGWIVTALERIVFPGYSAVAVVALMWLVPALVHALHRHALQRFLAAQQLAIAQRLSSSLEPVDPYRGTVNAPAPDEGDDEPGYAERSVSRHD